MAIFKNFLMVIENLEISDTAIAQIIDELKISISEYGSKGWGGFQNGELTKTSSGYSFRFPNSSEGFNQDIPQFIDLFASKITKGSVLFKFLGSNAEDGGEIYQIIADSEVVVRKFEIKSVEDTNYSLIKPLYNETPTPTEPITYGSTLNAGDPKADEVELLGAGTIRFNALSAGDLDDVAVLANTKTANIVIDGTPISQLKFNSAYIGATAEFDHDSKTYTITIAEATITATLKA